jgi:hypothetical protein
MHSKIFITISGDEHYFKIEGLQVTTHSLLLWRIGIG